MVITKLDYQVYIHLTRGQQTMKREPTKYEGRPVGKAELVTTICLTSFTVQMPKVRVNSFRQSSHPVPTPYDHENDILIEGSWWESLLSQKLDKRSSNPVRYGFVTFLFANHYYLHTPVSTTSYNKSGSDTANRRDAHNYSYQVELHLAKFYRDCRGARKLGWLCCCGIEQSLDVGFLNQQTNPTLAHAHGQASKSYFQNKSQG